MNVQERATWLLRCLLLVLLIIWLLLSSGESKLLRLTSRVET